MKQGVQTRSGSIVPIRRSLMNRLNATLTLVQKPEPKPKKDLRRNPLSDQVIAAIRWDYERRLGSRRELAERYGATEGQVHSIVEWRTAVHIDPAPMEAA